MPTDNSTALKAAMEAAGFAKMTLSERIARDIFDEYEITGPADRVEFVTRVSPVIDRHLAAQSWQPIDPWRKRLIPLAFKYRDGNYVECLLCDGKSSTEAHYSNVSHAADCLFALAAPAPAADAPAPQGEALSFRLSDALGKLHVINHEASLLMNFTNDPNLNVKERGEAIKAYRLEAHHIICEVMDALKDAATTTTSDAEPHPEDSCKKCGRPNVVWFAPDELWNKYVRDNNAPGILCPVCFIRLVEQSGIHPTWSVAPRDYYGSSREEAGPVDAFIREVADEGCLRGRQFHCAEREPDSADWRVACKAKISVFGEE